MFGFPQAIYKIYKNNFLRKVEIKFLFTAISLKGKESLVNGFVRSLFSDFQLEEGVGLVFGIENKDGVIESKSATEKRYFLSKENKLLLQISGDTFLLRANGDEYRSFKSIVPVIENIEVI